MIEAQFSGQQGSFKLNVEFAAPSEGVTALFGPSGCGKTTVLRCVAGLTRLAQGKLVVDGEVWQEGRRFVPVHRRAIGYVFQEASLFPHLSVRENIEFGQKRAKRAKGSRQTIGFDDVVDLLAIAPLFDRPTSRLSGGERQRVAIGRALLSQPRLLLMDEPLSALDRMGREEILPYLEQLHRTLSIPVLYVSHDMREIERLADTLVLMRHGAVRAAGPIADLLSDPSLPLVRMPEPASVLDGTVKEYDPGYGLATIEVPGGTLLVAGDIGPTGSTRRLRIEASDVSLSRHAVKDITILNALPVRIDTVQPIGETQMTVRLKLGEDGSGAPLLSRVSRLSWDRLGFKPGDTVVAQIKAVALART
ncbi:molybdenum ABC transporter ATP-binding protein [Methyloceanibacter caenitepidi]|uniref:Molybdenum transport ATP-binding protein ModC n=1 Tax=Methyloceanibacter caenitepidi TaxID=1384459 RepID=A0A0A8K2L0_9HYPH|nr:molybdenum ABC transporter ATP-binding protein [Methyloceanibacter caenitepidi]BAQ16752.1 molybdenum transport ATP-binding protein ModC [Methyloceanibacter caenitepidi]